MIMHQTKASLHSPCILKLNIACLMIDCVGFTPYRQYFSHIMAVACLKKRYHLLENKPYTFFLHLFPNHTAILSYFQMFINFQWLFYVTTCMMLKLFIAMIQVYAKCMLTLIFKPLRRVSKLR